MITLLFSLLQFLFFCICCMFIVRRYAPIMQKKQSEELSRQQNLEDLRSELKKSLLHADNERQEQILGCDILLSNVVLWKKCFEEHKHKEENNRRTLFCQAQEKHQKQLQLREAQHIQHVLFPCVVQNARIILQQKFLDLHDGSAYNTKCIDLLESKNLKIKKGSY